MQITKVIFHRFKKFRDVRLDLKPGVSLIAGGNNSGKTTVLQGLAIWEFARTVLETEKGKDALCVGERRQGVGLGGDEFTPVNVPSLKHLWTNLKTQKENERDGYTLWIQLNWQDGENPKHLRIGLSLVNDRIFVKTLDTTVKVNDSIPHIAYVPSFAGIAPNEPRYTPAIIRRYIGQGLPGSVLRNVILDLYLANEKKREQEKEQTNTNKLKSSFLKQLRHEDPYEQLRDFLQAVFSYGIRVREFNEVYHTNITIETFKGEYRNNRFQRLRNYNPRDLMVEGSGFLQWLTVLSLTLDPHTTLVLLDEPDAHLHPALQKELLKELTDLCTDAGKQIAYSTHSTELIKQHPHDLIMDANSNFPKYLGARRSKVSLLAGIGSEYTPGLADLEAKKRVFFVENESDFNILKIFSEAAETAMPDTFVLWPWASPHKERKHLFLEMRRMIADLRGVSLVDRDLESVNSVEGTLADKNVTDDAERSFYTRKWRRRHIEGYLLHADAIARAAQVDPDEVIAHIRDVHALDISGRCIRQDEPETILQANAKQVMEEGEDSIESRFGVSKFDIARAMTANEIPKDVEILLKEIGDRLG